MRRSDSGYHFLLLRAGLRFAYGGTCRHAHHAMQRSEPQARACRIELIEMTCSEAMKAIWRSIIL
jgi:hypothetical protein